MSFPPLLSWLAGVTTAIDKLKADYIDCTFKGNQFLTVGWGSLEADLSAHIGEQAKCLHIISTSAHKKKVLGGQLASASMIYPISCVWLAARPGSPHISSGAIPEAIEVSKVGTPTMIDLASAFPWQTLVQSAVLWNEVAPSDVSGCESLSSPVLAKDTHDDADALDYPAFLLVQRLRSWGWGHGRILSHVRGGPKIICLDGCTSRKSYLRALVQLFALFEEGVQEVRTLQHEQYYACILKYRGTLAIPPRLRVRDYDKILEESPGPSIHQTIP
jgi:hypothetical protein